MDIQEIESKLTLITKDWLKSKDIYNILFDIGNSSKDFRKILSISLSQKNRDLFSKYIDNTNVASEGSNHSLYNKAKRIISGKSESLSFDEYFILTTIFLSDKITTSIRSRLKEALTLSVSIHTVETPNLYYCGICSYPSTHEVCNSCLDKVKQFIDYRREDFEVPINFLNFNIKNSINLDSSFSLQYMDWFIVKVGNTIKYILQKNPENLGMVQYPLPMPDYQTLIIP